MTRIYYKEAAGALIFFDLSKDATLQNTIKWKKDLDTKITLPNGHLIPAILCANKCDLKPCIPDKLDEWCKEYGFAGWSEISAKDGIRLDEPITKLINKIREIAPENGLEIVQETAHEPLALTPKTSGCTFSCFSM